jgi:23S rRNA (guanosine2251-2'-O)-methyltransferase
MDRTIVIGLHAVEAAMASGHNVDRVYVASDSRVDGAAELMERAKEARIPVDRVPLAKLSQLAGSSEHQGVAARISPIEFVSVPNVLTNCPQTAMIVVLEQVQHPRNLGLVARTALASGASGIVISARGGASIDESVVRSSAGAVFRLPIAKANNIAQALRDIRDAGFWVYGLDASGDEDAFSLKWAPRSAIVVGNESEGLRGPALKACDVLVRVPIARGVESLNAAVAASVAMYQAASAMKLGPFSPGDA